MNGGVLHWQRVSLNMWEFSDSVKEAFPTFAFSNLSPVGFLLLHSGLEPHKTTLRPQFCRSLARGSRAKTLQHEDFRSELWGSEPENDAVFLHSATVTLHLWGTAEVTLLNLPTNTTSETILVGRSMA